MSILLFFEIFDDVNHVVTMATIGYSARFSNYFYLELPQD